MTIGVCPACGYPTLGPDLCAFCSREVALTVNQTFEPDAFRDEAAASRIGARGHGALFLQVGRTCQLGPHPPN